MLKNYPDYKSRFRILKGGKISLVVSAMVVGASLVGIDAAATQCITTYSLTNTGTVQTVSMCGNTSITVTDNLIATNINPTLTVDNYFGDYFATIVNNGSVTNTMNYCDSAIAIQIDNARFSLTNNTGHDINATNFDYYSATGINVNGGMDTSTILNDGHIFSTSGEDSAYGISVYDGDITDSNITNRSTATINVSGAYDAIGIDLFNSSDATISHTIISNAGVIQVDSNLSNPFSSQWTSAATGISIYSGNVLSLDHVTISNDGNITAVGTNLAKAAGIEGYASDSEYTGTSIINNSNITVTAQKAAYGIHLYSYNNGNLIGSTITNNHNITVTSTSDDAYGIDLYSYDSSFNLSDSNITNNHNITVTSTSGDAYGVYVRGNLSDSSIITNSHLIDVNASGDAYGIYVRDMNSNSKIINTGSILVKGGDNAYGIYAWSMDHSTITNSGVIDVNATVSSGYVAGIYVSDPISGSSISNENNITVTGSDYDAYGIYTGGMYDSNITNTATGTIKVTSTSDDAFGIMAYNGMVNSNITNGGTITSTGSDDAFGISVGYYSNRSDDVVMSNSHILNTGDINVTVTDIANNVGASGIYVNGGISDSTITNSGNIIVSGGEGDATGISVYGAISSDSTITNSSSGVISVSSTNGAVIGISAFDNNGTILNEGTISLSSQGTVAQDMGMSAYINEGAMTNSGLITIVNENNVTSSNGATFFGNQITGMFSAYNLGNMTNTGTISVDSNNTSNNGNVAAGMINLFNIGNVVNSGDINVTTTNSDDAIGILSIHNGQFLSSDSDYTDFGNLYSETIENRDSNITNSGSINVASTNMDALGIDVMFENLGNITNSGSMIVSSLAGTATGIASGINLGNVTNSGTIEVSSTSNDAFGIVANDNSGDITNTLTGTIEVNASQDFSYSFVASGYGIKTHDNNGTITNDGNITVTAYNAFGINTADLSSGSIENTGHIAVNGDKYSYGIKTDNLHTSSSITNSGTIIVNASGDNGWWSNGYGIKVGQVFDGSNTITNSGTIEVNAENAYGIFVSQILDGSSIENTGTISANGTSSAYGIKISEKGYGSLSNSGTITAKIDGSLDANAYSVYSDYSHANVINTGTLNGNIHLAGNQFSGDASLTNHGMIALPWNANIENEKAAHIDNFTNSADGTLEIAINTEANGDVVGRYSQLETKTATFEDGSTLDVNVQTLSGNRAILAGKTFDNVVITNSDSDLTIEGTLNITDNSFLLDFTYLNDGEGNIDLVATKHATILDTTVVGLGNGNAQGAASALDVINGDNGDAASHPQMQTYIAALNGLTTQAQVAHAVESTTSEVNTASVGANIHLSNSMQNIVEMRQRQMSGASSLSSGDEVYGDKQVWIKPFVSFGKQQDKDGQSGFDVHTKGFGFGFDDEFMTDNRVGLAVFYSESNVNVNNVSQTNDMTNWTALLYGSTPLRALGKDTQFLYQLGYSTQTNKTTREIYPTYEIAKADYTSNAMSADVKLMGGYQVNKEFSIRPIAEFNYRHFINPSYNETGAGAMNLQVQKATLDQSILNVGGIFEYKVDSVGKFITDLRAGYNFNHEQAAVTSNYAGATDVNFQSKGIDNGGFVYDAGIGYELSGKRSSIDFMYNVQGEGSSFTNNILSAKYVYKF